MHKVEEVYRNSMPQEQFNTLILQMILNIQSRQAAYNMKLAEWLGGEDVDEIVRQFKVMEDMASKYRVDSLTDLYRQFGDIHPDILELLNPKNESEI